MLRTLALPALAALALAGSADALEIRGFAGDQAFIDRCAEAEAKTCMVAVGELRGGNGEANGDWEAGLRLGASSAPAARGQVTLIPGAEPLSGGGVRYASGFALSHVGADVLTLVFGGDALTAELDPGAMASVDTLFIRARSSDKPEGASRLSGLTLSGAAAAAPLPDLEPAAPGSDAAAYLQISRFDFGAPWTLSGTAEFDWGERFSRGSRLGQSFTLADLFAAPRLAVLQLEEEDPAAAVPLPGALPLLGAALALAGVLLRRRR